MAYFTILFFKQLQYMASVIIWGTKDRKGYTKLSLVSYEVTRISRMLTLKSTSSHRLFKIILVLCVAYDFHNICQLCRVSYFSYQDIDKRITWKLPENLSPHGFEIIKVNSLHIFFDCILFVSVYRALTKSWWYSQWICIKVMKNRSLNNEEQTISCPWTTWCKLIFEGGKFKNSFQSSQSKS